MKLSRHTKRLVIRPSKVSDYTAWFEAQTTRSKPKNIWDRKARSGKDLKLSSYKKIITSHSKQRKADEYYDFGVFRKSDKKLVGSISLFVELRGLSQTAYLGYRVYNNVWGTGYAKEAVKAVLDTSFKDLKFHRIEAGIEPGNKRSIALAKSLKMRFEGCKSEVSF